jgi:hypothetical protein
MTTFIPAISRSALTPWLSLKQLALIIAGLSVLTCRYPLAVLILPTGIANKALSI